LQFVICFRGKKKQLSALIVQPVNILKIKVPLRTKKQPDVTKVEPSTSSTENLKTKKTSALVI